MLILCVLATFLYAYNTFPYWMWSEISLNLLCEGLSHTSEKSHIPLSGLSLVPEVWQPPTRRTFDTGWWLVWWRQLSAALLLEKTVLHNKLRPCHPPPLEPRGNGQHYSSWEGWDWFRRRHHKGLHTHTGLWFWTTCFLSNWSPRRPLGIACVFVLEVGSLWLGVVLYCVWTVPWLWNK